MSSAINTFFSHVGRIALRSTTKRIQLSRFIHNNKSFGVAGSTSLLQVSENVLDKTARIQRLHTKGDTEMAEFLREEITNENKSERDHGDSLRGFTLQTSNSCNVTFTKKGEETVNVKFSVNDSVDDESSGEYGEQEQDVAPALKSKPPFVVEISKDGENFLCIHCAFPAVMGDMETGGDYEDAIEIVEVSFRNEKESSSEDGDYNLLGHVMDANMYDMLLNMLEERGVDGNFVESLVDFSTAYEHKMYVGFLEKLQKFALSD